MNYYMTISVLNVSSYILISLFKNTDEKIGVYISLFLLLLALVLFIKAALIEKKKPNYKGSLFIQPIFILFFFFYSFHILGYV